MIIIGKFIVNLWYFARVIFVGIHKYGYVKSPVHPYKPFIPKDLDIFIAIYIKAYRYGKMLGIYNYIIGITGTVGTNSLVQFIQLKICNK